jgi:hypothetical protein
MVNNATGMCRLKVTSLITCLKMPLCVKYYFKLSNHLFFKNFPLQLLITAVMIMTSMVMLMLMLFMCQYFTYVKQAKVPGKVLLVPN